MPEITQYGPPLKIPSLHVGVGSAAAPSISIGAVGNGFHEYITNVAIAADVAGAMRWYYATSGIYSSVATGFTLYYNGNADKPIFTFVGDADTGLGVAAADDLRLISNGKSSFRVRNPTGVAGQALAEVLGYSFKIATSSPPASAVDTGEAGEIRWDASYIYLCVAANTWKRVAVAAW